VASLIQLAIGNWQSAMIPNYFNYFTEIEDAFVRRRGKHLLLSPMDWALIESWKEMNVPLHIALRGIEKSFDSWESKPRKRSVKSLLYCQEEVEAQFAEWLESRLGASLADPQPPEDRSSEASPFPRAAVIEHLKRGRAALQQTEKKLPESELTQTIQRVAALLEQLENDFATAALPDARRLEISLTGLEQMLSESLMLAVSIEELSEAQREVKEQLRPYRSHMDKAAYEQTASNLLLKRLRDKFGLPRLSLFYL
jgi:hypothetical protein